ncbi:MAG: GatB/YqeY domain-containing protein [Candidatus Magasanikbacteria bacterium]|nr:GatB/YqeY domain-containing protein [Candidatus Magasanikbacteria bacterium]MBT4220949.1 GatB/YqeY domain-containing protein [Candidatus Magasanikbacteria bacterium]MBT6253355.1 GatB/YqeY domain-containing protein [Candidatus Magasanikbacteria bacterium]MBT6334963.1 GatB/YqeY domain-containing protein [Candidatus Magasanikbacteria bacterium]MBT7754756.1 GatB/YqeY domain-containing protein [Candidatus Magasanikbacteria bacterium]
MSLKQTIQENRIRAMKEKDTMARSVLGMLISAIKNEEIDTKEEMSDEQVQTIVLRQIKQLNDAKKDFLSGERNDLVEKTNQEIAVLEAYAPAQLSDEELQAIVQSTIQDMNAEGMSMMGAVMGTVMGKVKGQANGNRVKEQVQKQLQ